MTAWKRFPVPEFNYAEFQDLSWSAPELQGRASLDAMARKVADGGAPAAAIAIKLDDLIAHKHGFSGEHLHAVGFVVPPSGANLLGRSHAWKIQRMLLLSGDGQSVAADWTTPRPMNTLLGPDDGIALAGGSYLAVCGHKYGEGWIGSRTLIQNGLALADGHAGYRILAASDDDLDDFNHVCLTISWKA